MPPAVRRPAVRRPYPRRTKTPVGSRNTPPAVKSNLKPQKPTQASRARNSKAAGNKNTVLNANRTAANQARRLLVGTRNVQTPLAAQQLPPPPRRTKMAATAARRPPVPQPAAVPRPAFYRAARDTIIGETDGHGELAARNERSGAALLRLSHRETSSNASLGLPRRYSPVSPEDQHLATAYGVIKEVLTSGSSNGFDGKWRRVQSGMDEALSTATMRSIVVGALNELGNIPNAHRNAAIEHFSSEVAVLSLLRQETGTVGSTRFGVTTQHQTNYTTATWTGNPRGGPVSSAVDHDLRRRQVATVALEEQINSGANLASAVATVGRRVADYHLNDFTASSTAAGMHPNPNRTPQELDDANYRREGFKATAVSRFGLPQLSGIQSKYAAHQTNQHDGQASPRRR